MRQLSIDLEDFLVKNSLFLRKSSRLFWWKNRTIETYYNSVLRSKTSLTSSLFTIMNTVNNKVIRNIEIFDFVIFREVLITFQKIRVQVFLGNSEE